MTQALPNINNNYKKLLERYAEQQDHYRKTNQYAKYVYMRNHISKITNIVGRIYGIQATIDNMHKEIDDIEKCFTMEKNQK